MKTVYRMILLLLCIGALGVSAAAADGETLYNSSYCFSATDFGGEGELRGIFVTAVPEEDVAAVCFGDRVIQAGDVLYSSTLAQLTLEPAGKSGCEAALSYLPLYESGIGQEKTLQVRITSGRNETPKADNAAFETYKNIPNDGTLTGTDPENGTLTFHLVETPKRGTVVLNADGSYVYTPNKNKVGEDSFTFTVTDEAGNVSSPATVKIRILKPTEAKTYADMDGSCDAFEAMWMAESGLCGGRYVSGQLCYLPDANLSRGEFLVMAMDLLDVEVTEDLTVSGFTDAQEAPAWMQPYLAAAMRCGMISGEVRDGCLVFRPNDAVTVEEAAVMLQNLLDLPVSAAAIESESSFWAADAVQALSEAGLALEMPRELLTRVEAAKLLYGISKL